MTTDVRQCRRKPIRKSPRAKACNEHTEVKSLYALAVLKYMVALVESITKTVSVS